MQNDIKRVVAYSTLSQLGFMTIALGVSAYPVAIFHLMTHAFFKALLFLAAGSVIMGMHHEQDMRKMGGLWKYMPITSLMMLIGSLSLIGTPFFSGFYSKDSIIEAVAASHIPGAGFAYFAVMVSVFVTALYSFRLYFYVFHGKERFHQVSNHANQIEHQIDHHAEQHHDADVHHGLASDELPHESPWVVTIPLILLAIPSVIIGFYAIEPMLFGDFFGDSMFIDLSQHPVMAELASEFHGPIAMAIHALTSTVTALVVLGVLTAALGYLWLPSLPDKISRGIAPLKKLLDHKYYLDELNQWIFAKGSLWVGQGLWHRGDQQLIDGLLVNGSAHLVGRLAGVMRQLQSGYLYHYAFAMILGLAVLLAWVLYAYLPYVL